MIYVVGSGPAGVSVATSLLAQGLRVTMLDAGVTLEADRITAVSRMRNTPPDAWDARDLARLREGMAATPRGVPLKHVYGSDFPYRDAEGLVPLERDGVDTAISLARGGFSNVWGSAVLPYDDTDMDAWPLASAELAPHYRAVLGFMPVSAVTDRLTGTFPLNDDAPRSVAPSRQAMAVLRDLEEHARELAGAGITFGRSRVAISPDTAAEPQCVYCGLCMYGCPHEQIYTSSNTLARLMTNSSFTYVPGVVAEHVEERGPIVRIRARRLRGGGLQRYDAERVYLACGPVSTSRLLMASLDLYDTPVGMLDSQYFLVPLLRYRGTEGVAQEALHTLAQLFVEVLDPQVSARRVHLQLYTYNDLYDATFQRMLGPAYGAFHGGVSQILNRMLLVQGYLHSDQSRRIELVLKRPTGATPPVLRMSAVAPAEPVSAPIRRLVRALHARRNAFRAVPVAPMLTVASAGRGFHSGGTFPMTRGTPGMLQSDVLGRPAGLRRVHAVDATVFPSIPATTITFSIMANAHRIGSLHHAA